MTSKRQRTSSTQGSQQSSEYEESSGSGSAVEKFISSDARDEYRRLMMKSIIKERGFVPLSTDGALVTMIENMQWVAVCETPPPIPLAIVREFYANGKADRNGYSVVRGLTVDYTPAAISRLLELPARPDGAEDWVSKTRADVDLDILVAEICVPGTVWTYKKNTTEHVSFPASALNRYARAWNLFLCSNLSPNLHPHEVTVERAILLYGILNEQYLDLGYLIYQNMRRFMRAVTSGAIPHASIVTRLCSAVGVRWGEDEPLQQPSGDIDSGAIARLAEWPGGTPNPRGLGYVVSGDVPHHPQRRARGPRAARRDGAGSSRGAGAGSSQAGNVSGMTDAQFRQFQRRMTRRVDASHEITRRMFADMTAVLDGIYQEQGIEPQWPEFGAHTVYPLLDSPPEGGDDDSDDE